MKLGSKFRPNSKVYGLFMPTCCLSLVRCERLPSPVLTTKKEKEEKEIAAGYFFREILLTGQELEFFHALKLFQMMIMCYKVEMWHFPWLDFEGKFPLGIYNIEDKRTVHFHKGETRGRLRNIGSLKLVTLGEVFGWDLGNSSQVCFPDAAVVPNL